MSDFIDYENNRISNLAKKIEKKEIQISDIDKTTIDELIGYYNSQISIKRNQVKELRKRIKGEK